MTAPRSALRASLAALAVAVVCAVPPTLGVYEPSEAGSPLVPKGLGDLVLAPDGMLYAAAWVTAEILRIDPASGAACAVAAGMKQPSSVRVATDFGGHTGHPFATDFGRLLELVDQGDTWNGAGHVWALALDVTG